MSMTNDRLGPIGPCLVLAMTLLTAGSPAPSLADTGATTGVRSSLTPAIQEYPAIADRTMPFNGSIADAPSGIGPGTQLLIYHENSIRECTANFVWANETQRFLGSAGHCFLAADTQSTHGEYSDFDPEEWTVKACVKDCVFGGAVGLVKAAYGVWVTGETIELGNITYAHQEGNGGAGWDFGVVEIPEENSSLVRPTVHRWDGPTSTEEPEVGEPICQYGYGIGPGETPLTAGRLGVLTTLTDKRWDAIFPGSQGDSGSAVVTCEPTADGNITGMKAVGVFTHIAVGLTGQGLFATTAAGTTIDQAKNLASTEANLTLEVVLPD